MSQIKLYRTLQEAGYIPGRADGPERNGIPAWWWTLNVIWPLSHHLLGRHPLRGATLYYWALHLRDDRLQREISRLAWAKTGEHPPYLEE